MRSLEMLLVFIVELFFWAFTLIPLISLYDASRQRSPRRFVEVVEGRRSASSWLTFVFIHWREVKVGETCRAFTKKRQKTDELCIVLEKNTTRGEQWATRKNTMRRERRSNLRLAYRLLALSALLSSFFFHLLL